MKVGRIDLNASGPVVLERPDGERVTLHLPMDLGRAARLFRVLGDEGFEFVSIDIPNPERSTS